MRPARDDVLPPLHAPKDYPQILGMERYEVKTRADTWLFFFFGVLLLYSSLLSQRRFVYIAVTSGVFARNSLVRKGTNR